MKNALFVFGSILVFQSALFVFSCVTIEELKTAQTETTQPTPSKEYLRSIAELGFAISEEEFYEDKAAIMKAIAELENIMARKDVAQWRKYLSPSSVAYLRNANNMRTVSAKLPAQFRIRSDEDYFKYVFIPSRQDRKIDEIRYVSSTITKAVQVRQSDDVIFYYFEKVNDVWLIKLDETQG
jgi:hypothetical protein